MANITNYIKESYEELVEKVAWPEWAVVQRSTVAVLVAAVLISATIFVMDLASNRLLKDFIYTISF